MSIYPETYLIKTLLANHELTSLLLADNYTNILLTYFGALHMDVLVLEIMMNT